MTQLSRLPRPKNQQPGGGCPIHVHIVDCALYKQSHYGAYGCVDDLAKPCLVARAKDPQRAFIKRLEAAISTAGRHHHVTDDRSRPRSKP